MLNICNPATQVMFVVASDNQQTSFPDFSWLSRSVSGTLNPTIPYHTIPYHTIPDCPGQRVGRWTLLYHTILFLTFLTVQVSEKIVLAETEMIKKKWTAPNCSFRSLVHVVVFASRWRKVVKAADNGNAYDMILPMRSSFPLPIPQRRLYTFFYRAMLCIGRTMLSKDLCLSHTSHPSLLWHCWLGHLTRKIVSEMT